MSNIIFMARLTDEGDFEAVARAERLLVEHGFSIGTTQRGSPRGILFGNFDIQKWRNLNHAERAALHGVLVGDRSSHAEIEIWDPAPLAAVLEGQINTVLIKRPPQTPIFAEVSPTDVMHSETRSYFPSSSEGRKHG